MKTIILNAMKAIGKAVASNPSHPAPELGYYDRFFSTKDANV
jgi:hypothetical protein